MKLDIVIVHYGEVDKTLTCIQRLQSDKKDFRNIIVVNNDIAADLEQLKKYNNVNLINSKSNLGYPTGANLGAKKAVEKKADAILFLNNDAVLEKKSLAYLKDTLSNAKNGVVAPVIEFKLKGSTYFDHGGWVQKLTGHIFHDNRKRVSKKNKIEVDFVSVCFAIHASALEKVGYFNESIFMYYEDVDLCLRIKKAGYEVLVTTKTKAYHESDSRYLNKRIIYHLIRSGKIFYVMHFLEYPLGCIQLFRDAVVFSTKSPDNIVTVVKALFS